MNDRTMQISDNIVEYEVENSTLKREAIANGDPRLKVADNPLGGASSLLFTKSVGGRILFSKNSFRAIRVIVKSPYF